MGTEIAPRWQLDDKGGIRWDVAADARLPHEDHVEMSGRVVSVIVHYSVDSDRRLSLRREIIWPTLRHDRTNVRGYLTRAYDDSVTPVLVIDGEPLELGPVETVRFDGMLVFEHAAARGIRARRTLYPSRVRGDVFERWEVTNVGAKVKRVQVHAGQRTETDYGMYGDYRLDVCLDPEEGMDLRTEVLWMGFSFSLRLGARRVGDQTGRPGADSSRRGRDGFVKTLRSALVLETPDPVLNRAFDMAKLRAAESVFETRMGLVHSPGGGRYYGGIWANDQAEYAGPFFPFLGNRTANDASLNAYRIFASVMTPAYEYLPSSFEVEGDVLFHAGGDRGDAAMVAYGASRFAMAYGSRKVAQELWPAIEWCLEYCRRKTNADGVVESDTDELEGRFPTGTANLSTSTLAYGGLVSAAHLGRSMGGIASDRAGEYESRAAILRAAIEQYFGATVEGFDTYRYYDGNDVLRAWICLPLTMGMMDRAEGTIQALFSPRLWTPDGLATQAGDVTFWDRSTLYGLRGVFAAGGTETALRYLTQYSQRRLLGEHVPYPVEAWPEGGQAHLSAESALYCRVFTEGLFGITPTGLRSFRLEPHLPAAWDRMALRSVRAFGSEFDVDVQRTTAGVQACVRVGGSDVVRGSADSGRSLDVDLP